MKKIKDLWQNYIYPAFMLVWITAGVALFFGWLFVTLYHSFVIEPAQIILGM